MTETTDLLVRLLAFGDSIWLPMRAIDWSQSAGTVLSENRRRFNKSGFHLPAAAADKNAQKVGERLLAATTTAGLTIAFGKERFTRVRLTSRGDIYARALVGLPNVVDAHVTVGELLVDDDDWISELALSGLAGYMADGCNRMLMDNEDIILPGLTREWIESNSDTAGRVWYRVTAKGGIQALQPEPVLPADLPKVDSAARTHYLDHVKTFRVSLRIAEPTCDRDIGYIPMPHSMGKQARRKAITVPAEVVEVEGKEGGDDE